MLLNRHARQLFGGIILAAAAYAEPIELTNSEAQKLWVALNQIPEGFTAAVVAADDATVLLPKVQAYEKDSAAKMRSLKVTQGMLDRGDNSDAVIALMEYQTAKAAEKITVELDRFDITAAEVPKLRVSVLAVLRQFLKPNPKPTAK